MTPTVSITLSKETKSLQSACRELIQERDKLRSKSADVLGDDKTALDKAETTLASLRAREDVVNARLPRRRTELYAAVVNDVGLMFAAAEAKVAEARDALRQAKADYREQVLAEHTKESARRVLEDNSIRPKSIATAERDLEQAMSMLRDAGMVRGLIDKATAEQHAETRAASPTGESYIKPIEHYHRNAARYVPELVDQAPASVDGRPWMRAI